MRGSKVSDAQMWYSIREVSDRSVMEASKPPRRQYLYTKSSTQKITVPTQTLLSLTKLFSVAKYLEHIAKDLDVIQRWRSGCHVICLVQTLTMKAMSASFGMRATCVSSMEI